MQLPTRTVIVEGIPGSGKTTTAHFMRDWLELVIGYITGQAWRKLWIAGLDWRVSVRPAADFLENNLGGNPA